MPYVLPPAYEVLFKKYFLSMCMVACRIVGDEDVAKDIVQEVFMRLWEKREAYDFSTTPDIFLYVTVKNKCFDYLRMQKKMPIQDNLGAADNEYFFRDILIEEETYRIVNEAIDALPTQSRRIIKLSLEGKQNKEISRLYQKSLGNKNFLSDIKKYRNISTLERGLLVRLVDKIYVLEEKRIEIHFNYDETTDILDKLSDYTKQSSELMKEVV